MLHVTVHNRSSCLGRACQQLSELMDRFKSEFIGAIDEGDLVLPHGNASSAMNIASVISMCVEFADRTEWIVVEDHEAVHVFACDLESQVEDRVNREIKRLQSLLIVHEVHSP